MWEFGSPPEGGSFGWYTDWWNAGRAGDPAWESYHLRTVIAWVERRLAIRPGRRWHAIAGWSMGGMGALYYASQRPYWTGHNPRALTDNLRQTRLYVRVGNGDGAPGAAGSPQALTERELLNEAGSFVAAARSSGADVELQVVHGLHNAFNRRAGLVELFRRLEFRAAQPEPPQWTYKTVTRTAARGTSDSSSRPNPRRSSPSAARDAGSWSPATGTSESPCQADDRSADRFHSRSPPHSEELSGGLTARWRDASP